MSVCATLTRLGGVCSYAELRAEHSRRAIRAAVASGSIVRLARGRYALAAVEEHRGLAHEHSAVRSHLSAAQAHGWKVKDPPEGAWLTVPRGRKMPADMAGIGRFSWAELTPAERRSGTTAPLRTVLDCARALPFDAALAVADQALRTGDVGPKQLRQAAERARGPGSAAVRRVARHADGRAANPFDSVLRAIVSEIPGLRLELQAEIAEPGLFAVVDLADRGRDLVLEAEGFEHHGTKGGFVRDRRRYTELTIHGWRMLPFVWIDVMRHPEWVRWCVEALLAHDAGRPTPPLPANLPSVRDVG
ncbi:MAG: hypothetical protein V9G19_06670 [Tetrasphaera sp.]